MGNFKRTKPPTVEEKAQAECSKMFNRLGWCMKTSSVARCLKCGNVIYPKHTGAVDTLAIIRGQDGPHILGVEVKAVAENRWEYNKWDVEQRRWGHAWSELIADGGSAWMWLQMGDEDVDSKGLFPRTAWLVPQSLLMQSIRSIHAIGIGYIPMNASAPQKMLTAKTPEPLHAEAIFAGYKLTHLVGQDLWWPMQEHQFWHITGVNYVSPEAASLYTTDHPRPDKFAVDGRGSRGISQDWETPLRS